MVFPAAVEAMDDIIVGDNAAVVARMLLDAEWVAIAKATSR